MMNRERDTGAMTPVDRLVARALSGANDWALRIGDELVPIEVSVDLDSENAYVILFLASAPADADRYLVYANGIPLYEFEGRIVAGRPARLKVILRDALSAAVPV